MGCRDRLSSKEKRDIGIKEKETYMRERERGMGCETRQMCAWLHDAGGKVVSSR